MSLPYLHSKVCTWTQPKSVGFVIVFCDIYVGLNDILDYQVRIGYKIVLFRVKLYAYEVIRYPGASTSETDAWLHKNGSKNWYKD